nr:hypothetical protein [Alteromonas macleodii]
MTNSANDNYPVAINVTTSLRTVPLTKYCELSGEDIETVRQRIKRGHWVKGVHAIKPPHIRELWIDLEAVEQWIRNGGSSLAG